MASLKQRVFAIFVRPSYVQPGPAPGYPNVVTKYIGELYRPPIGNETQPDITGNPPGYKACIKIPSLNASLLSTGDAAVIGGGIERYYDNIGRGRMPADKPSQNEIDLKKVEVEDKHEELKIAQEALNADPSNSTLIIDVDNLQKELETLMHELNIMNTGARTFSIPPFNENGWYSSDHWMLHSTWTSFDECKNYVRLLIDLLGFDGVLVANTIELELELLPTK